MLNRCGRKLKLNKGCERRVSLDRWRQRYHRRYHCHHHHHHHHQHHENHLHHHHRQVESERVGRLKEVGVNVTELLVAECRNPDRTIKVGCGLYLRFKIVCLGGGECSWWTPPAWTSSSSTRPDSFLRRRRWKVDTDNKTDMDLIIWEYTDLCLSIIVFNFID